MAACQSQIKKLKNPSLNSAHVIIEYKRREYLLMLSSSSEKQTSQHLNLVDCIAVDSQYLQTNYGSNDL